MKTVLAAVTSLAMLSSGCSIAFLEKPRVTPDNKVECDSTMKFPLIDGVVGVVGISTPFLLEYMRTHGSIDRDSPPYFIYLPLWIAGAGGAISAVFGYKRVSRCSDLKDSVAATSNVPPPAPMAPAPAPAQ